LPIKNEKKRRAYMKDYMKRYRAAQRQTRQRERNQLVELQRRLERLEKLVLGKPTFPSIFAEPKKKRKKRGR